MKLRFEGGCGWTVKWKIWKKKRRKQFIQSSKALERDAEMKKKILTEKNMLMKEEKNCELWTASSWFRKKRKICKKKIQTRINFPYERLYLWKDFCI